MLLVNNSEVPENNSAHVLNAQQLRRVDVSVQHCATGLQNSVLILHPPTQLGCLILLLFRGFGNEGDGPSRLTSNAPMTLP